MKAQTGIGAAVATLALGATTLLAVWPSNAQAPAQNVQQNKQTSGFVNAQFSRRNGRDGNAQDAPNGFKNGPQNNDDGPPPPPPGCGPGPCQNGRAVGRELGEMLHDMDLTTAQQSAIRTKMEANRDAMDKLRAQIRQLEEQTRAGIDSALTPAQRTQLEQAEQQLCQSRGGPDGQDGPPGGRRPGGRPGGPRGGGPDNGPGGNGYPNGNGRQDDRPRR